MEEKSPSPPPINLWLQATRAHHSNGGQAQGTGMASVTGDFLCVRTHPAGVDSLATLLGDTREGEKGDCHGAIYRGTAMKDRE